MTNFDNYLKVLNYLDVYEDGTVYRKERVWSNNGGTQIQPRKLCNTSIDGSGYHFINIMIDGKIYCPKVHLLVKIKFNGLPADKDYQIDHIDGNKNNNALHNLEWVSPSENSKRAFKTGLRSPSEKQKEIARNRMKNNNPMKNEDVKRKMLRTRNGYKHTDKTKE